MEIAQIASTTVVDQRALDPRALDVGRISTLADYFVIASGTSQRHVQGIADRVISTLKSRGERPLSVSGYENSEWIVIDYGDVVVHVLYEPTRHYYALDELWKNAEPLKLEPETQARAERLKTGTIA